MQEEHLATPVQFIIDDTLDFLLVEQNDFRLDGNAVGRRRLNDGKVTGAQQGELQGARNGRGSESKGIHRTLELTQFFFGRYAEFLLFIDNQQAQVLEFKAITQDFMRTYQDVDSAFF